MRIARCDVLSHSCRFVQTAVVVGLGVVEMVVVVVVAVAAAEEEEKEVPRTLESFL